MTAPTRRGGHLDADLAIGLARQDIVEDGVGDRVHSLSEMALRDDRRKGTRRRPSVM